MSIRRVAVIFDNQARPETTGGYCLRALRSLVMVEHFLPVDIYRIPRQGFDLYLNIDDGLDYYLPGDLHPCALWAIDTHLEFSRCLSKAHDFDFLFAAQRDGAWQLRDEGIATTWLPLACDPEIHRKHEVERVYDVGFVGHVFPGPRADLLDRLQRRFRRTFVGQCFFDEMARTYSASRLVFNRSIRNDINMRVFEGLACGSLLVTNDLRDNGQAELFRDGEHLATYTDADELIDKIAFYLSHETIRERMATAGCTEVVARHTYRHRMEQLLVEVEKALAHRMFRASPGQDTGLPVNAPTPGPSSTSLAPGASSSEPYDPFYFDFARPEVLALIPSSARRVLDIGCGAGRLGEALKARQPAEVVGVEQVEAAAVAARSRLDQVLVGDIEALVNPFAPQSFDAIVCADVLEHLREPGQLLRRARQWLRPEGRLIASVPNVRHHSVIRSLLDGNWTYEAAGLLDRTHLHFFTRRDIDDLFRDAGFTVSQWRAVPGPGYGEWQQQGRHGDVRVGQLYLAGLPTEEAEQFFVYQYLIIAVPISEPVLIKQANDALVTQVTPTHTDAALGKTSRRLRIMYLGDFSMSWRHETQAANALEDLGHAVARFQEHQMPSVDHVVQELNSGRYDCLLFYKGRIGARSVQEVFRPTGNAIVEVLRRTNVPAYTWYVDRVLGFDFDPSREAWMRQVAPQCRVVFVADGPLAQTDWARWHVLREPITPTDVQQVDVPEAERQDLAFIGQIYGRRDEELAAVQKQLPVPIISGVYGSDLSRVLRSYRIILGPHYPCVNGYWGNRVYVVLGHGGFFLAPEVEGMKEEGIVAGMHYAPLSDNPVADITYWLGKPQDRDRIARAGQELVLSQFTYALAAAELCRVIAETL